MPRTSLLALPLLLAACAPEAEVTGKFTTWLSVASSPTVEKNTPQGGTLELSAPNLGIFDCSSPDPMEGNIADCGKVNPEHYTWLTDEPWYFINGDLDLWRTEAIVTSEGDMQLAFHMDFSDGAFAYLGHELDLRVEMVVDPDFAPVECAQTADGGASLQPVDGADWVDQWSEDEDGMFIYYLNAGAYQLNPSDADQYWDLPPEWLAGYGHGKFIDDEFTAHATDYGIYNIADSITDAENVVTESWFSNDADSLAVTAQSVQDYAVEWRDELVTMGMAQEEFQLKVEDNLWRGFDGTTAGLEGWVQMDASWIRLDKKGPFVAGDTVSGDFQVLYDGVKAPGYMLVTGSFVIESLEEDRWGYPDLAAEKQAENDTPTCE